MLEQSIVAQGYEVEEGLIAYSRRVPMKRFARMDEVTPAILFIASDAASYITGAVLSVDGGTTATGPGAPLEDAKTHNRRPINRRPRGESKTRPPSSAGRQSR